MTTYKSHWNQESSLANTAELSLHCKVQHETAKEQVLRKVLVLHNLLLRHNKLCVPRLLFPSAIFSYSLGNKYVTFTCLFLALDLAMRKF